MTRPTQHPAWRSHVHGPLRPMEDVKPLWKRADREFWCFMALTPIIGGILYAFALVTP